MRRPVRPRRWDIGFPRLEAGGQQRLAASCHPWTIQRRPSIVDRHLQVGSEAAKDLLKGSKELERLARGHWVVEGCTQFAGVEKAREGGASTHNRPLLSDTVCGGSN